MKMQTSTVEVETSGKLEQTEFGISDTGMMMEHMITTIYSDKIGTICREIMSNARDAHREVKTAERPIRVKFPNRFEPTYEVRDWGPGIDPERMVKVFVQLGSSTKRNDNVQTGGFGIGAKTPWCYTDVFTIRSVSREKDGVIRRREYSAVKAGQKFTLHEMGEAVVVDFNDPKLPQEDRSTGTTIIVPVPETHNWEAFKTKTIYFTKYWDVRPELVGCDPLPSYPDIDRDVVYKGANWKVGKGSDDQLVLVDGIPYPFNVSALDLHKDTSTRDLYEFAHSGRQSFLLSYGVGELSLSLNREQLQYTEETKQKIIARLKTIITHVRSLVEAEIAGAPTYWDAHLAFQRAKANLPGASYIKSVKWNGHDVHGTTINPHHVIKISNYEEFGTNGDGSLKIRRKDAWSLEINSKTQWVLQDELCISRLKLVKLLEDCPNIENIQLIEFTGVQAAVDTWKADVNWKLFETSILKMSALAKPAPKKRVRGQTTIKTKGYELTGGGRFHDAGSIDLANGNGVYVLVERKDPCDGFTFSDVARARHALALPSITGIPKRFEKFIGKGWKHLKVAVQEGFAAESAKVDLKELNSYVAGKDLTIDNMMDDTVLESLKKALKKGDIKDDTCELAKYIEASEEMDKLAKKYPKGSSDNLLTLASLAGKSLQTSTVAPSSLPIYKAHEACKTLYPLLFQVGTDWTVLREWDRMLPEFVIYINAKNEA